MKQPQRSHNVVALATAATAAPNSQRPSERVAANVAEDPDGVATEPARTEPAQDIKSEGPPPAGSAVSDVLTRLEAAYRERVTAPAPAQPPPTPEGAPGATRANNEIAALEPARGAAPPSGVDVPTAPVGGAVEARVVAPATVVSAASAPAAVGPKVATVPAFAAEDAAPPQPPAQIHYGDVNQNTYVTNVREGDVYLIQLQQQLAVLQYMQLLGASSSLPGLGRHGRGATPQRAAFPSGITNPDNPWGFHFAPPDLVR